MAFIIVLDVNECRTKTHKCDKNAKCRNNKGSFTCICKTGYSGDGFKCQGILICILIVVCQSRLTQQRKEYTCDERYVEFSVLLQLTR